jgi:glycosyltransferase 2 family protein
MTLVASVRRRPARVAVTLVAFASLAFVVIAMKQAAPRLVELVSERPLELGASLFLLLTAVLWSAVCWAYLVRELEQTQVSNARLVAIFLTAWPARYVPGTLPYHMTRLFIAERYSLSRSAMAASSLYELILAVGSATALGLVALALTLGNETYGTGYVIAMAPFVLAPFVVQRRVLVPLSGRLLGVLGRPGIAPDHALGAGQGIASAAMYIGVHILNGLAFAVLVNVLVDNSPSVVLLIGVYSLACSAGVAVPLIPGGLGVREAVLTGLLSNVLSPETALVAAGSIRAVSIVADLVPAALVAILGHHLVEDSPVREFTLPSEPAA